MKKLNILFSFLFLITLSFAQERIIVYDTPPPESEIDCSLPTPIIQNKARALSQIDPYPREMHGIQFAHSKGWTGKGIKIAILDTGVKAHDDLPSVKEIRDYTGDSNCCDNHATHVFGTNAALDNTFGVVGSCEPDLYDFRVLDNNGSGSSIRIGEAIVDAADAGMDIISMSLGGDPNQALKDACDYAILQGCLVVAAAGNSGSDGMIYPAKWSNIISVFAVDQQKQSPDFSSHGIGIVSSGGVNILSTINNDEYAPFSGTSMATPTISGVLAIMQEYAIAQGKRMTQVDAINELIRISEDIGDPGRDVRTGYGIPDLTKYILKERGEVEIEPDDDPIVDEPINDDPQNNPLALVIVLGILIGVVGLIVLTQNKK